MACVDVCVPIARPANWGVVMLDSPGGCVATLRAALGGELATQRWSVQGGTTATAPLLFPFLFYKNIFFVNFDLNFWMTSSKHFSNHSSSSTRFYQCTGKWMAIRSLRENVIQPILLECTKIPNGTLDLFFILVKSSTYGCVLSPSAEKGHAFHRQRATFKYCEYNSATFPPPPLSLCYFRLYVSFNNNVCTFLFHASHSIKKEKRKKVSSNR